MKRGREESGVTEKNERKPAAAGQTDLGELSGKSALSDRGELSGQVGRGGVNAVGRDTAKARGKAAKRRRRSVPRVNVPLPLWLSLLILALAIAACFAIRAVNAPVVPEGELHVHFIDVGQGDAALLVTSGGSVLIDAGPTDARYSTARYIAERVGAIDLMILTHPHEDHVGGAAQILGEIAVGKVLMPDVTSTAGAFVRTLDAIEEHGVSAELASAGAVYEVGDMRLTVLGPLAVGHEDVNDDSLVVRVDFGRRSFLFTGDAESPSERELVGAYPITALDCDVLKVGHHGSPNSSCAEFLDAVRAKIAVISVGAGNDYGHPADDVLRRLAEYGAAEIYRTDTDGTVTLVCDGEDVRKAER